MIVGKNSVKSATCTITFSCKCTLLPIITGASSPLTDEPYHKLHFSPIFTSPTTVEFGAKNVPSPILGDLPLKFTI